MKTIEVENICNVVEDYFNLERGSVDINSRKREIVQARQIAMYFSKNLTKLSLASIGLQIGNKDHATVLHSDKTVKNLIDTDKSYKSDIENLSKLLDVFLTEYEIKEAINKGLMQLLAKKIQWNKIYKAML